jgi:hypothetical protein
MLSAAAFLAAQWQSASSMLTLAGHRDTPGRLHPRAREQKQKRSMNSEKSNGDRR